jgi:uncharacterized protein YdhG (YjbR/CyaY superfamily)
VAGAVDQYLAKVPKEQREALEGLRRTIRSAVPEVEEAIRSRVPAFRYKGRPLVSMGASKRHLSLFIMNGAVLEAHKDELRGFDTSNTLIRFSPDEPIPDHLVTKLVKARKAELDADA